MQEQNTLQVKIKKLHPDAAIPSYATDGDAGLDLVATSVKYPSETNKPYTEYGTGLAFEIPTGYVGLLFQRSSVSKQPLTLANAVGVLDSGYRGEVTYRFKTDALFSTIVNEHKDSEAELMRSVSKNYPGCEMGYRVGEKIGQLIIMPYPKVEFIEVDELTDTTRGANGYGSSGR